MINKNIVLNKTKSLIDTIASNNGYGQSNGCFRLRDDVQKKRVKNGTLAQKVGRYQNKIPI